MNLYLLCRHVYHALAPARLRRIPHIARFCERLTSRFGPHDLLYGETYFRRIVDGPARTAAPVFADLIMTDLRPRRVVDVGCGTGALLAELGRNGCDCVGLEYAEAGLSICRSRGLCVKKFDIEEDAWLGPAREFDVAVSTEVAQHLPERVADRYVDLLTQLAGMVVLSAAPKGQGGTDHVNEQPREYWLAKFGERGFFYEHDLTSRWSARLRSKGVAAFYARNLMVLRSAGDPFQRAR